MRMRWVVSLIMTCVLTGCASTGSSVPGQNQIEIAKAEQKLGESYYLAGRYAEALRKLLDAEKIIPNDPFLQNSLGLVYMVNERYSTAETYFTKALSIKPDYIVAKNHLGVTLIKQEKWDAAISLYEEMSQNLLYASQENTYANLGWAYRGKKEYSKAKQSFEKALEIRPCFPVASHGLATVYLDMLQQDECIRFLNQCLLEYPEMDILHADLARAYESVNDFTSAYESWKKVIELSPQNSSLNKEAKKKVYDLELLQ
ncbi:MAG: tetratricopeptide repeat protein [Desulfobacteraceae bacterium]|nr:MAG: tetratricopeptide repeat protein [Desulfobacteraceae bacterium]